MELLTVLYRDDHFIAVNKPAGLLVHRSKIDRHETRFAVQTVRDQVGRRVFPVHRLDKPTSGVLVFAFTPEAARALAEAFAGRAVTKTYLAVVRGYVDERREVLLAEGLDPDTIRRETRECPEGPRLLARFAALALAVG